MNITYDWKITAMKKAPVLEGLSDVITHIRFDYTGTDADSGETHVFPGACPIGLPDAENFTELASLTEADVIEWVKANHPTGIDFTQDYFGFGGTGYAVGYCGRVIESTGTVTVVSGTTSAVVMR